MVSNRYRLHFDKESQQELDLRKHEAKTKPLRDVVEVVYWTFTLVQILYILILGRNGN